MPYCLFSSRTLQCEIVLLTLGSPIWLSLGIAAVAVILSLYISLWAIIFSLGAVFASFAACSVGVDVSTGKAYLTDIACKSVISSGSTGDISLDHVIAAERFSINRSTAGIRLDSADAAEIFMETDTGDVTGTLLTDKVFITQTDTGGVDVPKTETGGRCEIITNTGNIRISVA